MAIGNPITLTSNVASKTINVIATASQSLFTVAGGYRINEIAVFRNGVRLVDGRDFTARDGSTVTLLSAASEGDAVEFQIFDTFRVADAITPFDSDQTIAGNLNITGILSASQLGSVNFNVTSGIQTFNDVRVGGALTVAGVLTFDDVTNVDSVGYATFRSGINVQGAGSTTTTLNVTGFSTFGGNVDLGDGDRLRFGGGSDLQIYHDGSDNNIRNTNGDIIIDQRSDDQDIILRSDDSSGGVTNYILCDGSTGEVKIHHYGTEKLTTNTDGIDVTGHVETDTLNVSGLSTFSGDVSIADKIVHTGDTNTAIRFPAADTFTVETGGSERLRVDSSGRVGIGTDSISSLLQVRTASTGANMFMLEADLGTNNNRSLTVTSPATDSSADPFVVNTGNSLSFQVDSNLGLHIKDNSSVGVGTASPDRKLHVFSTNGTVAHFESGNANEISQIVFEGLGASAPPILGATGEHLQFTTNNLERIRITSAGNVGIATANPGAVLSIQGGESATPRFAIQNTTASTNDFTITQYEDGNGVYSMLGQNVKLDNGGNNSILDSSFRTAAIQLDARNHGSVTIFTGDTNAVSERLRITSEGRVLIATTAPNSFNGVGGSNNLIVAGSTSDTDITDNSSAAITISNKDGTAGNTAGLHFAREDTDGTPHYSGASIVAQFEETQVTGQYPKADLAFLTSTAANNAPSEKARLDSAGNLKLGTTTLGIPASGSPPNTFFVGRKAAIRSVTVTTTLDGSGEGTFDLGRIHYNDDESFEILLSICTTANTTLKTSFFKIYCQKVRGTGLTNFVVDTQAQGTSQSGFSIDSLSAGTAQGVNGHGLNVNVTGGTASTGYTCTALIHVASKNNLY